MPSTDITPNIWAWQHEAYAQDDFKVNPHLTVYAGVRWCFFGQPTDTNNLLDNFDPAAYNAANAPKIDPATGNIIAGTGNNPQHERHHRRRQELALRRSRSATRRTRTSLPASAWPGIRSAPARPPSAPATASITIPACYGTYEQNIFANPPYRVERDLFQRLLHQHRLRHAGRLGCPRWCCMPRRSRPTSPTCSSGASTSSSSLAKDTVLEVGYFGSKGTHLLGIVDINQAYPGRRSGRRPAHRHRGRAQHHDLHHRRRSAHQRRPPVSWLQRHQHPGDGVRFQLPLAAGQLPQELPRRGPVQRRPTPGRRTSPITAATAPTPRRTATTGTKANTVPTPATASRS